MKNQIFAYIEEHYGIEPEHPFPQDEVSTIFRDPYSDKWFVIFMSLRREILGLPGEGFIDIMNVKGDPDFIGFLVSRTGYMQAYHMNKKHWLTVLLDGSLPLDDVLDRVDDSYNLIVNTPSRRIYEAVKLIPSGHVATYGQVAELAGNPKMSRAVGNALHKNPDPDHVPCFRVVNSKGELAGAFAFGGEKEQANRLRADGVEVVDNCVDLERFGIFVREGRVELE